MQGEENSADKFRLGKSERMSRQAAKLKYNPHCLQMEAVLCRFRNKYLPLFGSYCEKSSSLDHLI